MSQNLLPMLDGAICLIVLAVLWRSGRFLRTFLFSAFTGNLALFAVSWFGSFSGVTLLPNLFTIGASTVLGIPGVIGMLVLKLLFST